MLFLTIHFATRNNLNIFILWNWLIITCNRCIPMFVWYIPSIFFPYQDGFDSLRFFVNGYPTWVRIFSFIPNESILYPVWVSQIPSQNVYSMKNCQNFLYFSKWRFSCVQVVLILFPFERARLAFLVINGSDKGIVLWILPRRWSRVRERGSILSECGVN